MKNWIKRITGLADLEVAAQVATDTRIAEEKRISALIIKQGENLKEAHAEAAAATAEAEHPKWIF